MELTSKQRAYLKSLAAGIKPLFGIGKSNLTPELTDAVAEAFATHEIIKVNVLKSTADEQDAAGLRAMGEMLAERTRSTLVCVIGRKIVLYKPYPDSKEKKHSDKIVLPK